MLFGFVTSALQDILSVVMKTYFTLFIITAVFRNDLAFVLRTR